MTHLSRLGLRLGTRHLLRLCESNIANYQSLQKNGRLASPKCVNVRNYCSGAGHCFEIVDYDDFKERVLHSDLPVVVDFHAEWCGPCKQLGPRLEAQIDEKGGGVLLAKVNVDDNADLAIDFGVQGIPHVIAFKGGQQVDAFTGAIGDEQISEFIDKLVDQ